MKSILFALSLLPLTLLFAQNIDNITPNEAEEGETLNVTITGTNTSFTQATSTSIKFYFTASTTTATIPNYYTAVNDETIQANLTVPAGTPTGWYDYSLANQYDGLMYNPSSFKVNNYVGLTTYNSNDSYKVYPNPFKNSLSVEISSERNESAELALIDISGKVVQAKTVSLVNGQNIFEMNNLNMESGVYFMQLTYSNGNSSIIKVVKD